MTKTAKTGVYTRDTKGGVKTYYIRYKHQGKLITKKVGTNTEGFNVGQAVKIRSELMAGNRVGSLAPGNVISPTLADAYAEYSAAVDVGNNASCWSRIKPHLGDKRLDQITVNDVREFHRYLSTCQSSYTKRPLKESTINQTITQISTLYNFMNREHDLGIPSPAKSQKRGSAKGVKLKKADSVRERYLSTLECSQLLYHIRQHTRDLKYVLFAAVALTTGARASSILKIRYRDVNFTTGTITIKNEKMDRTYTATLHPSVRVLLDDYNNGAYIIGGKMQPMAYAGVQVTFKKILDRLFNQDLDPGDSKNRVVIHTFRHTFGSLLAIAGTPVYTIMRLMDHTEIEQTLRYAKLAPDAGSLDVKKLAL